MFFFSITLRCQYVTLKVFIVQVSWVVRVIKIETLLANNLWLYSQLAIDLESRSVDPHDGSHYNCTKYATCSLHNNLLPSTCYCSLNVFSFSVELLNFRDLIVIDLLNAEAKKYDGNKSLFLIQNESIWAQYNFARAGAINVYIKLFLYYFMPISDILHDTQKSVVVD